MNEEKFKILFIKYRVYFISLLILFIGIYSKYRLSTLFPHLQVLDVVYLGEILIEFSIIFFIGNKLIDKYKDEVNKKLFSDILDKKIGLKDAPLLTELANINSPFAYNVISHEVNSTIKKSKTNINKYDVIQTVKLKLSPRQDNVHYKFGVGGGKKRPKIEYIRLNDKQLINKDEKDIRKIKQPYSDNSSMDEYQIIIPLKKGNIYEIEFKVRYFQCMSDLISGGECDFHEYNFFALTERTVLKNTYEFPNFEQYEFRAEKRYMNLPDVISIECRPNPQKKNSIIVESSNLKNGEKIYIIYTKKINS